MEQIFNYITIAMTSLYGLAALIIFCAGIYLLFNKKSRRRQLADLKAQLDELEPTDPKYNQARALYISMMIDSHRGDLLGGSDTGSESGSSGDDSGGSGSDD